MHLNLALNVHQELAAGHLGKALTLSVPYPPFAYLVGSLGITIGGVGVAPPIVAENLVFVTLLALGCYKVGRLAFSPLAGLLAVVFALGSPLIAAQFHVFMTDAPETAMVAVSVWLVIASEGFTKLRACALAGVAVGLGMLTKEPFPIFVLGVGLVTLGRGGRRAWPGVAVFAAIALAIALPWYIPRARLIQGIGDQATRLLERLPELARPRPQRNRPPAPVECEPRVVLVEPRQRRARAAAAAAGRGGLCVDGCRVGALAATIDCGGGRRPGVRRASSVVSRQGRSRQSGQAKGKSPPTRTPRAGDRDTAAATDRERASVGPLALELTVGAFLSWAILTETYFHDTRYSMPLLLYPAVFAGGWIAHFTGRRRAVAVGALVAVVVVNMMGSTFGVGKQYRITLPGASPSALQQPGYLTLYPGGFLVSGPHRDGDLLATLQALRSGGRALSRVEPAAGHVRTGLLQRRRGGVRADRGAAAARCRRAGGCPGPARGGAGAREDLRPRSSPLRHARRRHGRVDQGRQSDGRGRPGLLPAAPTSPLRSQAGLSGPHAGRDGAPARGTAAAGRSSRPTHR